MKFRNTKLNSACILSLMLAACIGDKYDPSFGPKTSMIPSVFERLPEDVASYGRGEENEPIGVFNKCLKLSADGNADASYAAAIIVGQGHIPNFQSKRDKELEMIRIMRKAKEQGSIEASDFIQTYESRGIEKW